MHLLIALVLQATTPSAVPATETPAQETTPIVSTTSPAAPVAAPTPQTEVRCRWVAPTGQRLRQRVCETVELLDERAHVSEQATHDMRDNRGISQ
jgi:hypothetical protein